MPRARTPEGERLRRARQGAGRLGITAEEYLAHQDAGEKWCSWHKAWHPRGDFAADEKRADGLRPCCREADAEAAMDRWHGGPRRPEE